VENIDELTVRCYIITFMEYSVKHQSFSITVLLCFLLYQADILEFGGFTLILWLWLLHALIDTAENML